VTSAADAERVALCDLLDELGPSAPTLCEGWRTLHLAAHLTLRDRAPQVWPGLLASRFSGPADRALATAIRRPYPELVAAVRAGAPIWSPMGVPLLKDAVNLMEYVIHHEDVRRAQPGWGPRAVPSTLADQVWTALRLASRPALRRAKDGVLLRRAGSDATITAKGGALTVTVTVTGDPIELALFVSGRGRHARVELTGDDAAVARLEATTLAF
jgi:uncharacterized protein (TIGR03085 family)